MRFLGIDLCSPQITLIEAQSRPSDPGKPPLLGKSTPLVDQGGAGESPWDHFRDRLRLQPGLDLDRPEEFTRNVLDGLQAVGAPLRSAIEESHDSSTPLVFIFPYRTPPILRRHLPALVGRQAIPIRGGMPEGRPLIGVEAPVALALETVARRDWELPARLLLVTGEGPTRELSAVSVNSVPGTDVEQQHLRVEVLACFPVQTPDQIKLARQGLRSHREGWRFVAEGPEADGLEETLGLSGVPIMRLGDDQAMARSARPLRRRAPRDRTALPRAPFEPGGGPGRLLHGPRSGLLDPRRMVLAPVVPARDGAPHPRGPHRIRNGRPRVSRGDPDRRMDRDGPSVPPMAPSGRLGELRDRRPRTSPGRPRDLDSRRRTTLPFLVLPAQRTRPEGWLGSALLVGPIQTPSSSNSSA